LGLLRIFLAVCVFCSHSRPVGNLRWLEGDLAVELFFVLSGFYMQLVLSIRYTRTELGKAWFLQFYKARYFRLLPIYLLGSLLVVGTASLRPNLAPLPIWNFVWNLPSTLGNLLFESFLYLTNATILFQDWILFFAVHSGEIHWSENFANSEIPLWQGLAIPQAWSLGIELSFYFVAPYLLNLRSRWLILGACCSLSAKVIVIRALHLGDPWTYRFFPFELGYFLLGALAYRYRSACDHLVSERVEKYWYWAYLLVMGFAAVRAPMPLATLVYPMALACALPFLFKMTSRRKADRLIGELSYPFYIFHGFALTLAGFVTRQWWHGSEESIAWVGLGLTLVLSAIGLALEFRFIEPWRVRLGERDLQGENSEEALEGASGDPGAPLG
jgi:peptidoglycan/LPS O-acetylase OafA/YrhL